MREGGGNKGEREREGGGQILYICNWWLNWRHTIHHLCPLHRVPSLKTRSQMRILERFREETWESTGFSIALTLKETYVSCLDLSRRNPALISTLLYSLLPPSAPSLRLPCTRADGDAQHPALSPGQKHFTPSHQWLFCKQRKLFLE